MICSWTGCSALLATSQIIYLASLCCSLAWAASALLNCLSISVPVTDGSPAEPVRELRANSLLGVGGIDA